MGFLDQIGTYYLAILLCLTSRLCEPWVLQSIFGTKTLIRINLQ